MAKISNPINEKPKILNKFVTPQNGKSPNSKMKTLKPYSNQTTSIETPLLSEVFAQKNLNEWPIKVNFPGWRKPPDEWRDWVEKLSLKYAKIWAQTGICDGILSSLHEIKHNPVIILAMSEFWCPKTNTFMFPFGEATITLEDVMVLAGLPVLGEPVNMCCSGDSRQVLDGLNRVRSDLSKNSSAKKASYSAWIKYFNEESKDDELEHVGFLVYWLSRFVFPDINQRTVGKHVFPIAVLLSKGVKIALAPAVLSCLYQNLAFLTQQAAHFDYAKREISVAGSFQIVHVWALERFPLLGLNLAKRLSLGQPRIARWDKVVFKESLVHVRSTLRSLGNFSWRPYALDLENWRFPSYYPETELIVSDNSALEDEQLMSFRICLRPQQLVGIDCAEIYQPQRVARQFGYDQEFPGEATFSDVLASENVRMFVASRKARPVVSEMYREWWKESMSDDGRDAVLEGVEQEGTDHNKAILTSDLVKSEPHYDGDSLANVAAPSTPTREIVDYSSNDSGKKRKLSMGKKDSGSQGVVIVDIDDEDGDKSSGRSEEEVRRRVGDCADNPLYITDQSSKVIRRGKKTGVSLENPIDVESYYI